MCQRHDRSSHDLNTQSIHAQRRLPWDRPTMLFPLGISFDCNRSQCSRRCTSTSSSPRHRRTQSSSIRGQSTLHLTATGTRTVWMTCVSSHHSHPPYWSMLRCCWRIPFGKCRDLRGRPFVCTALFRCTPLSWRCRQRSATHRQCLLC